jgi:hypothetical protein
VKVAGQVGLSRYSMTILSVVRVDTLQYREGWKPIEDVQSRIKQVDRTYAIVMLMGVQGQLEEWAKKSDNGAVGEGLA